MKITDQARRFYTLQFQRERYAGGSDSHALEGVRGFVGSHGLAAQRVLEVGCGRGWLQDVVEDWTGVDLSPSVASSIRKPFVCCSAEMLPFPDDSFDAVWSIHALEHVPRIERALAEMARVILPGGVLFLKPAWFCRPWAAKGYQVRPWRDLRWTERLVKASIPVRNSPAFRAPGVMFERMVRELIAGCRKPTSLHYRWLDPNYEVFWQSDSDACISVDPHEVLLWFVTRGWQAPGRETFWGRLTVRTGALVFKKPI